VANGEFLYGKQFESSFDYGFKRHSLNFGSVAEPLSAPFYLMSVKCTLGLVSSSEKLLRGVCVRARVVRARVGGCVFSSSIIYISRVHLGFSRSATTKANSRTSFSI